MPFCELIECVEVRAVLERKVRKVVGLDNCVVCLVWMDIFAKS